MKTTKDSDKFVRQILETIDKFGFTEDQFRQIVNSDKVSTFAWKLMRVFTGAMPLVPEVNKPFEFRYLERHREKDHADNYTLTRNKLWEEDAWEIEDDNFRSHWIGYIKTHHDLKPIMDDLFRESRLRKGVRYTFRLVQLGFIRTLDEARKAALAKNPHYRLLGAQYAAYFVQQYSRCGSDGRGIVFGGNQWVESKSGLGFETVLNDRILMVIKQECDNLENPIWTVDFIRNQPGRGVYNVDEGWLWAVYEAKD